MVSQFFRRGSKVPSGLWVVIGVGLLAARAASASSVPVSTGNGDTTCGHLDANWTVQGPNINGGASEKATILSPSCGNWYGSWAADNSSSSWIDDTSTNPTGSTPYTFTMAFNLSTVTSISGTWYIDDNGTLNANGHLIQTESDTFSGVNFTIPTSDLNVGTNTITVVMTSDDDVDDGVRVQFNPMAPTVPEASSVVLLCTGLLGSLGLLGRKLFR